MITLKAFCTARCTSTRSPLGAPAIPSTPHWPSIDLHPSIPFCSKSKRSADVLGGTLSSSAMAHDPRKGCIPNHCASLSILHTAALSSPTASASSFSVQARYPRTPTRHASTIAAIHTTVVPTTDLFATVVGKPSRAGTAQRPHHGHVSPSTARPSIWLGAPAGTENVRRQSAQTYGVLAAEPRPRSRDPAPSRSSPCAY